MVCFTNQTSIYTRPLAIPGRAAPRARGVCDTADSACPHLARKNSQSRRGRQHPRSRVQKDPAATYGGRWCRVSPHFRGRRCPPRPPAPTARRLQRSGPAILGAHGLAIVRVRAGGRAPSLGRAGRCVHVGRGAGSGKNIYIGGPGGSLEPPGALLTHLHAVYMAYSECQVHLPA
jgi:hypothetical protein